jgi:hypothetical protein
LARGRLPAAAWHADKGRAVFFEERWRRCPLGMVGVGGPLGSGDPAPSEPTFGLEEDSPLDSGVCLRLKPACGCPTGEPKRAELMEIYLDRRAIRQIKVSAQEAIEEGDTEASREEIIDSFSEDQIEEIERRLAHGDMFEFITDVLDEWSGEDIDELFEIVETQLAELGLDLKVDDKDDDLDDDDDVDDDEDDDDEDDDDVDDVDDEEVGFDDED